MNAHLRVSRIVGPESDTWQLSIEIEASGVTVVHELLPVGEIDGLRISMKVLNDNVQLAKNGLAEAVKKKRDELTLTLQGLSPLVESPDPEA